MSERSLAGSGYCYRERPGSDPTERQVVLAAARRRCSLASSRASLMRTSATFPVAGSSTNDVAAAGKGGRLEVIDLMDVTNSLDKDHGSLDKLFDSFQRVRREHGGPQRRQELLQEITRTLSAHAAAEEQVVYPVVAHELPDGARLAASALKEHQAAKQALEALGKTPVDDDEFDRRLEAIILDVRHHMRKEEGEIFEKLRGWLGKERLKALGDAVASAGRFAPTRPHSMMPNRPPFNTLAAPATALVDRMLDAADQGRAKMRQAAQAALGTLREAVDERVSDARRQAQRAADRVETAVQAGRRGAARLSRRAGLTLAASTDKHTRTRAKTGKSAPTAGAVSGRRRTKGKDGAAPRRR